MRAGRRLLWGLAVGGGVGALASAGEVPGAVVVLQVFSAALPHHVPEAAPPRFALMEDGQVFVGGTSRLAHGRLESKEQKDLERRLAELRRLPGLSGSMSLGPGDRRHRLLLRKGRPLDLSLTGDPARAPPELRPLGDLVHELARFTHPSLRPYQPGAFAVSAREGTLPGGCRSWPFPQPPSESIFAPRRVPAAEVSDWPTGASPACVCVGDKRYVVTFRPLLPGEEP